MQNPIKAAQHQQREVAVAVANCIEAAMHSPWVAIAIASLEMRAPNYICGSWYKSRVAELQLSTVDSGLETADKRETDRQTDTETGRQAGRQRDRQRDRQTALSSRDAARVALTRDTF